MIVYKITNTVNGKIYIGQTTLSLKQRFESHIKSAKYKRSKSALHEAISKYSHENFTIEQIEIVDSIESLNEKEIYWINKLGSMSPNGYNLLIGGASGGKKSEEVKMKQSKTVKNKYSEGFISPVLGFKHSEETKAKISESKTGKLLGPQTEEHRSKIGISHKGIPKPKSEEWKRNQSQKMTGRVHYKESRAARSVKLSKKVVCLTDGKVFNSIKEAAAFYGVGASNLSSLLAKRIKSLTSKNDGVKLSFEFWSK